MVRESTAARERAVEDESTEGWERAEDLESTVVTERAGELESTDCAERAIPLESAVLRERADLRESTDPVERAARGESTETSERAVEDESTAAWERAVYDESTETSERAGSRESTGVGEHRHARASFTPLLFLGYKRNAARRAAQRDPTMMVMPLRSFAESAIKQFGRRGAQTAERPRLGACCLTFGSSLLGEACETERSWQAKVSHKFPEGATGILVPMAKPITTGILSSPHLRRPIDRVASRVTLPGIHYTQNGVKTLVKELGGKAEAPPLVNRPHDTTDLAGLKIGQLVVIRYLGHKIEQSAQLSHSRWLVRCICGKYEHRRGASLRRLASSAEHQADRCTECQNLRRLRSEEPLSNSWSNQPISTSPTLPGANDVFVGGEKFGRLTVIGYGGTGSRGGRWVVRCDCGAYGLISSRGVKRGGQQCDGCYAGSLL